MTVATFTTNMTDIYVGAGSTTGWTALGGGAAGLNAETDYFIQGTGMTSKNAFASDKKGMILNDGTDRAATIGTDGAVLIWTTHTTPNSIDTLANGGIDLLVGSGTSAYKHFYVGGSDTIPFMGWIIAAVNPSSVISEADTGSPSAVEDHFGVLFDLPSGGPTKGAPNAIDAIRVGRCDLIYEFGNGAGPRTTFQQAVDDKGDVTDRLGLIQERDGSFFMSGLHMIGDNGGDFCQFVDLNEILFWNDHWKVTYNFNTLEIQHASTTVDMDNLVWKALGKNSPGRWLTTQNAVVNLTQCTFVGWGEFTFDTNTTVDSCIFNGCGQVDANGSTMNGSIFSDPKPNKLADAQDETNYDNSPTTEGVFTGGTGYVVGEIITLDNAAKITVDAVSSGVVTEFTVDAADSFGLKQGIPLTQVFASAAGTGFILSPDTVALDNYSWAGALLWDVNTDPDGKLDNMSFDAATPHHAIEFGPNIPTTEMTLRGCTFSQYSPDEDTTAGDETFWFRDTTGTITLNLIDVTGPVGYRTDGVVVTIVSNPSTTKVTTTEGDGTPIENVRVFLETADGGPGDSGLAFEMGANTLVQSAGVATYTTFPPHKFATGDQAVIRGASIEGYNKVATVTVTGTTTFTYAVDSGLGSPAGGSPKVSYVALHGLTDVNGEISELRTWPFEGQSLKGWTRKSTSAPFYKQSVLNVADAILGTDLLVVLTPDE